MDKESSKKKDEQLSVGLSVEVKSKKAAKLSVEEKIEQVKASKMPDHLKNKYIEALEPKVKNAKLVPFSVYANIKKIPQHIRVAMQAYPPAKSVKSATVEQWEAIYKKF